MARLVLLSFKDNGAAEEFVRQAVSPDGIGLSSDTHVEWIIARPVSHCQCDMPGPKQPARKLRKKGEGWTQGKRFGWWLHPACGRVSKMVKERFVAHLTNGYFDLLPEILGTDDEPNDVRRYYEHPLKTREDSPRR